MPLTLARPTPRRALVGLNAKLSHWMVNEYNRRCQAGERFQPGVLYLGFLDGFAVQFGAVAREHRAGYMRSACWLHDGPDFEAVQLIWPTTPGVWPWESRQHRSGSAATSHCLRVSRMG